MTFAVHDLVRFEVDDIAPENFGDAPAWVATSLRLAPWAVVRRVQPSDGIGVGIRGATRAERYASSVAANVVRERVAPEALCAAAVRADNRFGEAARSLARHAAQAGLAWGPIGSFGFELASGRAVTTSRSDLDIVVRAEGAARAALHAFARAQMAVATRLGAAVDVELAFACGGIALPEFADRPARVLAKTPHGPQLVPCP
jgi:phosphoribosyl-dephospho-CoA transferase